MNNIDKPRSRDIYNMETRFTHTVNSRISTRTGLPIPTVAKPLANGENLTTKRISDDSIPMNFLPVAVGAAAVKQVIFKGDETIVLFDGGERISVVRSSGDNYDRPTAVAWAIMKFCFGKSCSRQISRIIKKKAVYADELHKEKVRKNKKSSKDDSSKVNKKTK